MSFREIPLSEYPRRAHFEYFTSLSNPFVGVTAEVDVTELKELCKHRGRSFYLAFIDAAARAADCVPALRQRIHSGAIREYDACPTSHTEPLGDGTYCYCTLRHDMPMDEYMEYAVFARKNANMHHDMHKTMHDFAVSKLRLSTLRTPALQASGFLNISSRFDWFHSQNITVQHFNFITLRIFQVAESRKEYY